MPRRRDEGDARAHAGAAVDAGEVGCAGLLRVGASLTCFAKARAETVDAAPGGALVGILAGRAGGSSGFTDEGGGAEGPSDA